MQHDIRGFEGREVREPVREEQGCGSGSRPDSDREVGEIIVIEDSSDEDYDDRRRPLARVRMRMLLRRYGTRENPVVIEDHGDGDGARERPVVIEDEANEQDREKGPVEEEQTPGELRIPSGRPSRDSKRWFDASASTRCGR